MCRRVINNLLQVIVMTCLHLALFDKSSGNFIPENMLV